jgi:hypothetical protein
MVDEYDKPILDVLDKTENAETIRQFLNAFYGVLKGSDEHLRFVFLTGVTKFAGVSVFSGLNNLSDITLHPDFPTICGYTQQELETCFAGYITRLAHKLGVTTDQLLERARHWYDGYSWDGENFVYNPFSTLRFFGEQRFANYWFTTGTPTFLINTLKKRERAAVVLIPFETGELDMSSYNPDTMGEVPLLFQTGYLTIKKIVRDFDRETFTLCTPNGEVNDSFLRHLLNAYSAYPVDRAGILKRDMERQLLAGDASALEQSLRTMLALVPYPLHIGKEAYYHSLLLVWLRLLGFDIEGEIMTDNGRIDAVLRLPGHIIIAEVKYRPPPPPPPAPMPPGRKWRRRRRRRRKNWPKNSLRMHSPKCAKSVMPNVTPLALALTPPTNRAKQNSRGWPWPLSANTSPAASKPEPSDIAADARVHCKM